MTNESQASAPALGNYPPLTADLEKGFSFGALKYFGAGAIIASVTIGSGETFFASKGGAIFGYTLMWCFVASAIMKGIQVYVSARYMTLTGEHPMTRFGELPGPRNWVPWFFAILSIACFPFWLSGLPLMIGTALNWMIGIPFDDPNFDRYALYWGTAILIGCGLLSLVQTYAILEKVQTTFVALLLLGMAAAYMASSPDLMATAKGLVPTIPAWPEWFASREEYANDWKHPSIIFIGTCLGAIGGGIYDYIGYIGCFREKAWGMIGQKQNFALINTDAANISRGRGWLLPVKIDVGVGFLCVFLFTIIFVSLGAEILNPQQVAPGKNDLLNMQAAFLTGISPSLEYLYKVGIFMAFFGTIYGAFEIYVRTARECLSPISLKVRNMGIKPFRLLVVAYCVAGALPLMWLVNNAAKLVEPAAIVGGVLGCGLWCFAMFWADRKILPKPLQMGTGLTALLILSGATLTGLGIMATFAFDWGGFINTVLGR